MKVNTKDLSCELVRALRGPLSQGQLNRKLGSDSNQVHRWEKGHARISWLEFLELTQLQKLKLPSLFEGYFHFNGEVDNIPAFLVHLFAGQGPARVSRKVGISEGKLRRLLKGSTGIQLDDLLKILFALDPLESMPFVHDLAKGRKLPCLALEKSRIEAVTKEYFSNPELGLLLVCLNLPGYKKLSFHRDSWLADVSGIPVEEVRRLLALSLESGLISREKSKYTLSTFRMSDRGGREQMVKIRRYWTERAIKKLGRHSKRDAFGSLVFTTSHSARNKIVARYLRFFEDMKRIVEEDGNAHEVPLIMNFHLFNPGIEE